MEGGAQTDVVMGPLFRVLPCSCHLSAGFLKVSLSYMSLYSLPSFPTKCEGGPAEGEHVVRPRSNASSKLQVILGMLRYDTQLLCCIRCQGLKMSRRSIGGAKSDSDRKATIQIMHVRVGRVPPVAVWRCDSMCLGRMDWLDMHAPSG